MLVVCWVVVVVFFSYPGSQLHCVYHKIDFLERPATSFRKEHLWFHPNLCRNLRIHTTLLLHERHLDEPHWNCHKECVGGIDYPNSEAARCSSWRAVCDIVSGLQVRNMPILLAVWRRMEKIVKIAVTPIRYSIDFLHDSSRDLRTCTSTTFWNYVNCLGAVVASLYPILECFSCLFWDHFIC